MKVLVLLSLFLAMDVDDGDEVIQVYIKSPTTTYVTPIHQLMVCAESMVLCVGF